MSTPTAEVTATVQQHRARAKADVQRLAVEAQQRRDQAHAELAAATVECDAERILAALYRFVEERTHAKLWQLAAALNVETVYSRNMSKLIGTATDIDGLKRVKADAIRSWLVRAQSFRYLDA